jgi:hypothetical protein
MIEFEVVIESLNLKTVPQKSNGAPISLGDGAAHLPRMNFRSSVAWAIVSRANGSLLAAAKRPISDSMDAQSLNLATRCASENKVKR